MNDKKNIKNANLNVKLPLSDYEELQAIAQKLGGMTLSSMVRYLIYSRLDEVRKSGDPREFLNTLK